MFILPFTIIDEGGGSSYVEIEKPKRKKKPELKEDRNGGNPLDSAAKFARRRLRRLDQDTIPGSEEWVADRLFPRW